MESIAAIKTAVRDYEKYMPLLELHSEYSLLSHNYKKQFEMYKLKIFALGLEGFGVPHTFACNIAIGILESATHQISLWRVFFCLVGVIYMCTYIYWQILKFQLDPGMEAENYIPHLGIHQQVSHQKPKFVCNLVYNTKPASRLE